MKLFFVYVMISISAVTEAKVKCKHSFFHGSPSVSFDYCWRFLGHPYRSNNIDNICKSINGKTLAVNTIAKADKLAQYLKVYTKRLKKLYPGKKVYNTVWLSSIKNGHWHNGEGEKVSLAASEELSSYGHHCVLFNMKSRKWRYADCYKTIDAPSENHLERPLICEEGGHTDYPNEGGQSLPRTSSIPPTPYNISNPRIAPTPIVKQPPQQQPLPQQQQEPQQQQPPQQQPQQQQPQLLQQQQQQFQRPFSPLKKRMSLGPAPFPRQQGLGPASLPRQQGLGPAPLQRQPGIGPAPFPRQQGLGSTLLQRQQGLGPAALPPSSLLQQEGMITPPTTIANAASLVMSPIPTLPPQGKVDTSSEPECPPNFTSFEGACFKKIWKAGTVREAERMCEKEGGTLAHFETVKAYNTLRKFLRKNNFYSPNYKKGDDQNLMIDSVRVQSDERWTWLFNKANAWPVLKRMGYQMSGFMMDTTHVLTVDLYGQLMPCSNKKCKRRPLCMAKPEQGVVAIPDTIPPVTTPSTTQTPQRPSTEIVHHHRKLPMPEPKSTKTKKKPSQNIECKKNFIAYEGQCFLFLQPDKYVQASKNCQQQGGHQAHLADFSTQKELKTLRNFVQKYGKNLEKDVMLAPVVKLNNIYAWRTSYKRASLAVTLKGNTKVDGAKNPQRFLLFIKRNGEVETCKTMKCRKVPLCVSPPIGQEKSGKNKKHKQKKEKQTKSKKTKSKKMKGKKTKSKPKKSKQKTRRHSSRYYDLEY